MSVQASERKEIDKLNHSLKNSQDSPGDLPWLCSPDFDFNLVLLFLMAMKIVDSMSSGLRDEKKELRYMCFVRLLDSCRGRCDRSCGAVEGVIGGGQCSQTRGDDSA